jgi:hypothetical protein
MAINFLNTIDLNKNSLDNARIQNLSADPTAANSSIGQIYFNTTADTLKQYVADKEGSGNPGWVEVGSDSVTAGTGIGVTLTGGNAVVRNTGLVTVLDGTYINLTKQGGGDNTELTADLNAADGTAVLTTRFLSKDNTWDIPVFDSYDYWVLDADGNGATANILSGATADFVGGLKITTDSTSGGTLNIVHDLQTQTDSTSTSAPSAGGTFTVIDSVTVDTTGHVGGVNVKTITLPRDDYSIVSKANPTLGADIDLVDSGGVIDSTVTVIGTAAEIVVAQSATAGTIVISQPSDVTIGNDLQVDNDAAVDGDLTVAGTGNFTGEVTVPTATAATSAPNLAQVELLVAGVGVFKGGYNATTDPGVAPNIISGTSNIALDQGDYFVVTHDGDITFSDSVVKSVETGDFIFASTGITAASDPASTAYIFVIADANVAGKGATDGATEKGVAGFDSASFDVSAAGWVTLLPQANPYGSRVILDDGGSNTPPDSPSTRAESGGLTTFTVDVTESSNAVGEPEWFVFGTSALAANVKAEITQVAAPYETVYADVARSGAGTISFAFTGTITSGDYAVLLTYV